MGVRARKLKLEATEHAIVIELTTGFTHYNVRINAKPVNAGMQRQEIALDIDANKAKSLSRFFAELAIDLRRKNK